MAKRPKSDPASLLARMVCFTDLGPDGNYRRIILTTRKNYVTAGRYEVTDEGYERTSYRWSANFEAQTLSCEVHRSARDCDGKTTSLEVYECPFNARSAVCRTGRTVKMPSWLSVSNAYRDHSAEKMNY